MEELTLFADTNEFDELTKTDVQLYDQRCLRIKILDYSVKYSPSKWSAIRQEWDKIEMFATSEPPVSLFISKLATYCLSVTHDHPPVVSMSDEQINLLFRILDHRLMVSLKYQQEATIKEFIFVFFRRVTEILLLADANLEQHLLSLQLFGKFQAKYGPPTYDDVVEWLQSFLPTYQPQIPELPPPSRKLCSIKTRPYSMVAPPASYSPVKTQPPERVAEKPHRTKISISDPPQPVQSESSDLLRTPLIFISAKTNQPVVYPPLSTKLPDKSSPVVFRKPVVSTPPNLLKSKQSSSISKPAWSRGKRAFDVENEILWEDKPRAEKSSKTREARYRQNTRTAQQSSIRATNRIGRLFFGDSNLKSPRFLDLGDVIYAGGSEFTHLALHLHHQNRYLSMAEQIVISCGINDIMNVPLSTLKARAYKFFSTLLHEHSDAFIIYVQIHIHKLPKEKKADAINFHNFLRDHFSPQIALLRPPTFDDRPLHHLNRTEDEEFRKFLHQHLPNLRNTTSPRVVIPPETYCVHLPKFPSRDDS